MRAPKNRLGRRSVNQLQGKSPENGSFLGFGWRLLGILGPKSSNVGLQRLLAMRKARIWRAFLIEERKFSKNKTAWLGREDSNLRMVESKSADDDEVLPFHLATIMD
jgi:hypothetical protein